LMENISKLIDHTLLKPQATSSEIEKLCEEAKQNQFASVCINPFYVSMASRLLEDTNVKVCTVIGFPLGASTSAVKAWEAADAVRNGADEIDMVINIGALKDRNDEAVQEDIAAVVRVAEDRIVKVIIETCLLTEEEKIRACRLSKEAGARFVKTSTGFSTGGATMEDVRLMKSVVGDSLEVKASGGVRNRDTMIQMVAAGASRIGTSNGVLIVTDGESSGTSY
jgi:deoxyribose-phosphate aldolase